MKYCELANELIAKKAIVTDLKKENERLRRINGSLEHENEVLQERIEGLEWLKKHRADIIKSQQEVIKSLHAQIIWLERRAG